MKKLKQLKTSGWFRRGWLLGALLGGMVPLATTTLRADQYDTLRLKYVESLTGGTNYSLADSLIAAEVVSVAKSGSNYWASLNTAPGRTYLWSDLASTTDSSQISAGYGRLYNMALAYVTYGSTLQGNTALLADISNGLDWMNANRYGTTATEYDNWFDWQIGIPQTLDDITALLYSQLSAAQITNYMAAVNKFTPTPQQGTAVGSGGSAATAANLVWQAHVVGVRGCLVKDAAKLALARDALSGVFPYVTNGDGFYVDGSFIQHSTHPYNGGYGASLLQNIAILMTWLNGSTWTVTDPQQTNIVQWVYSNYEPLVYKGAMMDMVRGRGMAMGSNDHAKGQEMMQTILQISQFAPTNDAALMRALVKYWAQADTTINFAANAPLPLMTAAEQLMSDGTVTPLAELLGHYTLAEMDRVVHLRPGWGFGIAMSSKRISNYETINGANLHGWYSGDGMTYLYNGDLLQYGDNFWFTVDPYRLPGTTVDPSQIRADGSGSNYLSTNAWVGGATLDNYGSAGMQLKSYGNSLVAIKSWFMFDNEIVCLGAGIKSTDNRDIETIMENRNLHTSFTNEFSVNGTAMPAVLGWSTNLTNVSWAHLAGSVGGSDIGYYFPLPASVNGLREARTGSQSDITTGYNTNDYTRNYLTLWLDHGTNPVNATYAYVLLPNYSALEVSNYAANPSVSVLTNTVVAQAARDNVLGVTAANFWSDGTNTVDFITSNRKAAVVTSETNRLLELAVSDPTQTNTGAITVTLNRYATALIAADPGVTVLSLSPQIVVSVAVSGAQGRSFQAQFTIARSSTTSGGPWSAPTTWVSGSVPASTDDVVIATSGSGSVYLDGSNTVHSLIINAGARFSMSNNGTNETLMIDGNLANNGSFIRVGGTPAAANTMIFNGTSSLWTGSGNISTNKISVTVNAGATLDISGLTSGLLFQGGTLALTVNGTLVAGTQVINGNLSTSPSFTLAAGGTLVSANVNGITNDSSCTVYNFNAVNLSPAANYVFSGTANQSTLGLPATVNSLTDNNTGGTVTLGQQTTVAASVTLAGGAKLSLPAGTTSTTPMLMIGGVIQSFGTWGNTGSGAAHIDAIHFAGTGRLSVANGPADAAHSTISPATASIPADGVSTQLITVQTYDANSHLLMLGGSTVVISRASGTGTIGSTTDNGDGTYTATVTSLTTIGSGTFTATMIGTAVGTAVGASSSIVTYTAGPPTTAQSTVTASPTIVRADGLATSTITVTLTDVNSNPVSGKTVSLVQSSGPGTPIIGPPSGASDASGAVTFAVKSITVGADYFTATDTTDSVTLPQTVPVLFVSQSGIVSTTNGGPWSLPATWLGGVVPVSTNDVMIATTGVGYVALDGSNTINSMTINAGAQFSLSYNGTNQMLMLNCNLANYGSIMRVGGTPAVASVMIFNGTPSLWTGSGDVSLNKVSVSVNTGTTLDISGCSTGMTFFNGTLAVTVKGTLIAGAQVIAGFGGAANNTFTLSPGGTLTTANVNGITNDSGCTVYNFKITSLSTTANYVFNGTAAQATIGLPVTVNSLTDNNTGGTVTLGQQTTVTTNVTLAGGAKLSLPAGTTSTANALVIGGLLQAAGTWGNTGSGATHVDATHFAGTGRLSVATGSTIPTTPTPISYSVSGTTLTISWPAGYLGWILQSQTNALNHGLGTNWVDVAGTAGVTLTNLTINPVNATMFFRLRYP